MEPGVDYSRIQHLQEEGAVNHHQLDVEGESPPQPAIGEIPASTNSVAEVRFCPACGAPATGDSYCTGCGKILDSKGVSKCECGRLANFTCGYFRGRVMEETREVTCRKHLCGEHVKLVFNNNAHSEITQNIDMCETCKTSFEAPQADDGAMEREKRNTIIIAASVVGFIFLLFVISW